MNIDEILHECILANGGETIRVTKACFEDWMDYAKDNPSLCVQVVNASGVGNDRITLMSRKVWERHNRQQILKQEQEIDRKRAQIGRENFQEFKEVHKLNPTIASALACLAEKVGMEEIKRVLDSQMNKPKE